MALHLIRLDEELHELAVDEELRAPGRGEAALVVWESPARAGHCPCAMRACLLLTLCAVALSCGSRPPPTGARAPAPEASGSTESPASRPSAAPAAALEPAPSAPAPAKGGTASFERRCGWVDNPTPANWWLTDRDDEWTIGIQGGYQAKFPDDMPGFGTQWVQTNRHYGYGCACMDVQIDRAEKRVVELRRVKVLPIERCRRDKALPRR
jgi:hypothetical protein